MIRRPSRQKQMNQISFNANKPPNQRKSAQQKFPMFQKQIKALKQKTKPEKLTEKQNVPQKVNKTQNDQGKAKKQKQIENNKDKQKRASSDKYPNAEKLKVVFLGDGNCGKTSALISYTTNKFNQDYIPTIFDTYEMVVQKNDRFVKLQLWDTAGQQQYKKLRSLSYPKTDVFFLCFSLIDKRSFVNATQKWYPEVKQNCPRAEIIFVGTKVDLKSQYMEYKKNMTKSECQFLDEEQISKKVNALGHKFFVCSAITQAGLSQMFDFAVERVIEKRKFGMTKTKEDFQCQII